MPKKRDLFKEEQVVIKVRSKEIKTINPYSGEVLSYEEDYRDVKYVCQICGSDYSALKAAEECSKFPVFQRPPLKVGSRIANIDPRGKNSFKLIKGRRKDWCKNNKVHFNMTVFKVERLYLEPRNKKHIWKAKLRYVSDPGYTINMSCQNIDI